MQFRIDWDFKENLGKMAPFRPLRHVTNFPPGDISTSVWNVPGFDVSCLYIIIINTGKPNRMSIVTKVDPSE